MNAPGSFNRGSVTGRLASFFEANPTEELTIPIIVAKFGMTEANARRSVSRLQESGLLEAVRVIRLKSAGAAK